MTGPPALSRFPKETVSNGESCKEKVRLLDAFSNTMTEYARVQNEPQKLPEDERKQALTNARREYERAKLALRLHRKEHGC